MTTHVSSESDQLAENPSYTPASTPAVIWLIARSQVKETLFARRTIYILIITCVILFVEVHLSLEKTLEDNTTAESVKGIMIAVWLAWAALLNSTTAINAAASAFVGDRERGSLMPLLATPASNLAIFTGKIFGAVIPSCCYTVVSVIFFFGLLIYTFSPSILHLIPYDLASYVLIIAVGMMIFGAGLASVVSSRVKTLQTAQSISSVITSALWIGLFLVTLQAASLGTWAFPAGALLVVIVDIILIVLASVTWRREEVMARL